MPLSTRRQRAASRGIPALRAVAGVLALAALALAAPARAQFQPVPPGTLPAIDARVQAAIVDSVTAAIDSVYVDGEAAARISARLRAQLSAGAYRELTDPALFVRQLETDAQAVHSDGHFGMAVGQPAPPPPAGQPSGPADDSARRRANRARNYGFAKVEILPGNVGYLKLDSFSDTGDAGETAVAAMNFLANADALIIDLRANGGGSASMIRLLAGYLFAESTHLINWDIRAEKKTDQSWSADHVPGRRLAEVPVYVLTSRGTFSAAEEFTFDLRHLERATVVGDTTGGGGNTVVPAIFDFGAFRVGMRLPHGRAYDPKTGQGWEGVGVIPHLPVPSEQALAVAHREALKKRLEAVTDEGERARLAWALQGLEGEIAPPTLTAKQLGQYAGSYGPRRIWLAGGVLHYQREGRPAYAMAPLTKDLFRVAGLDYFRIQFERDASGKVAKLVGLYDDGRRDENPREGSR